MSENKKIIILNKWFFIVVFSILFISTLFSLFLTKNTNGVLTEKIAVAKEEARPADLNFYVIEAPDCEDCFDINNITEAVKRNNVNIVSNNVITLDDPKSKDMINKYNIQSLPSLVIVGEVNKEESLKKVLEGLGEINDDTFVYRKLIPPFYHLSDSVVKGRIQLTMIEDKTCKECYMVKNHATILQSMGLPTGDSVVYDASDSEAKTLIEKYDIAYLPAFVLTGDIDQYPNFKKIWPQVGTVETDGSYVMRKGVTMVGVYKDLGTNKIVSPKEEVAAK